jgi:NitT/TauT family transport system substrate-binding protein
MQTLSKILSITTLTAALVAGGLSAGHAAPKKEFKVAWSIYVGWMPWGYAAESGIVKKWADKYGITIEVKQFNDYVESINQYTAGGFDAVTITNMDALSIPAAGGVDTTAVIVGDFSNGNDAVILKNKDKLKDILGQNVNLVEYSVSHYLLARAGKHRRSREGAEGGKHLRRRHGGGVQDARRHRGGDLEADRLHHPRISRRQTGVRQLEDSWRDHRFDGRQ